MCLGVQGRCHSPYFTTVAALTTPTAEDAGRRTSSRPAGTIVPVTTAAGTREDKNTGTVYCPSTPNCPFPVTISTSGYRLTVIFVFV